MIYSIRSLKIWSLIFAISIFILGFQNIYFGKPNPALFPFGSNIVIIASAAYISGAIMLISSAGSIIHNSLYGGFLIIGILMLLSFLFAHLSQLISNVRNPNEWTGSFETIAIMSGAFLLAAVYYDIGYPKKSKEIPAQLYLIIKLFFASALVVFGILHLMYADFIASLIPDWISFHIFWTYLVGVGFFAASISLIVVIKQELAMNLLGAMFLFWVVFVHAPRVFHHFTDRDEWSSLLIALAISGISFSFAATFRIVAKFARKINENYK